MSKSTDKRILIQKQTTNRFAPLGYMWQCRACGKQSKDLYGSPESWHDYGWDESCSLNAVLIEYAD